MPHDNQVMVKEASRVIAGELDRRAIELESKKRELADLRAAVSDWHFTRRALEADPHNDEKHDAHMRAIDRLILCAAKETPATPVATEKPKSPDGHSVAAWGSKALNPVAQGDVIRVDHSNVVVLGPIEQLDERLREVERKLTKVCSHLGIRVGAESGRQGNGVEHG